VHNIIDIFSRACEGNRIQKVAPHNIYAEIIQTVHVPVMIANEASDLEAILRQRAYCVPSDKSGPARNKYRVNSDLSF
jgi:hypothetical protein